MSISRQHNILFHVLVYPIPAVVTRQKRHIPAEVKQEFGRFALSPIKVLFDILMYHANGRIHFTVEVNIKSLCSHYFCCFQGPYLLYVLLMNQQKKIYLGWRILDWFSLLKDTQISSFILSVVFQKVRMTQKT